MILAQNFNGAMEFGHQFRGACCELLTCYSIEQRRIFSCSATDKEMAKAYQSKGD
jgi:hypothetical protein